MIAYAPPGNRRSIDAMRRAGWRMLLSPKSHDRRSHGFPYAIDNGAWTAYQQGIPFNSDAFRRLLDSHGENANWIAVPDIVTAGRRSLDFSVSWLEELKTIGTPLLIPVQDGMEPQDLQPYLHEIGGVFVGGSTDWKVNSIPSWAAWARQLGLWCHVGRVNSRKRIRHCALSGVNSFDGTSVTRFAVTLPPLDEELRQLTLFDPATLT